MNIKHILLGIWLLAVGGLTMSSCTKNDDSTIVLIGTEYYIKDILAVIPDTLQTRFMAEFGSIPEGSVPPKIEGSYVMNPKQRLASNLMANWPLQADEPPTYLRFTDQHNGLVKMDLLDATETMTDTVFVCGNADSFAVYFIENKFYEMELNNHTYHFRMERGVIMKGQVAEEGLRNFRYATIVLETEDDTDGLVNQYDNGTYFIYKDGDGLAENNNW